MDTHDLRLDTQHCIKDLPPLISWYSCEGNGLLWETSVKLYNFITKFRNATLNFTVQERSLLLRLSRDDLDMDHTVETWMVVR